MFFTVIFFISILSEFRLHHYSCIKDIFNNHEMVMIMSVLWETGVANRFPKLSAFWVSLLGKSVDCLHERATFLLCRKEISFKELKVINNGF